MNTLLISYDLKTPGKDYHNLITFLKSTTFWAKPLESVWLIKSNLSAENFRNSLLSHIDSNDKLLVLDITKDIGAWFNLPKDVSEWIIKNI